MLYIRKVQLRVQLLVTLSNLFEKQRSLLLNEIYLNTSFPVMLPTSYTYFNSLIKSQTKLYFRTSKKNNPTTTNGRFLFG